MERVKCKLCGNIGYTASPHEIICKCGGRFRVIREKREKRTVTLDSNVLRLFNFSGLLNYENN